MTTIKLIPSVVEFDVSLDSASMPSLFNQSIETTIIEQVEIQVAGRIPTHQSVVDDVCESVREDRDFSRKIRDWVMESIDYYDIKRQVLDDMDYSEIAESLINDDSVSENLQRAILNNSRFRSMITTQVGVSLEAMNLQEMVNEKIEQLSINMANNVAEKVLETLITRLRLSTDV
jgi:murein endopeptidase